VIFVGVLRKKIQLESLATLYAMIFCQFLTLMTISAFSIRHRIFNTAKKRQGLYCPAFFWKDIAALFFLSHSHASKTYQASSY